MNERVSEELDVGELADRFEAGGVQAGVNIVIGGVHMCVESAVRDDGEILVTASRARSISLGKDLCDAVYRFSPDESAMMTSVPPPDERRKESDGGLTCTQRAQIKHPYPHGRRVGIVLDD